MEDIVDKNNKSYPRFSSSTFIVHGTKSGYDYHRRVLKENACMACTEGHAAYWRDKRANNGEHINALRRAHRKEAGQTLPIRWYDKHLDELIELYGTDCHVCGGKIDLKAPRKVGKPGWEYSYHPDHLIPLSKGGEDVLENIRPAHGKCNSQKWATHG